LQWVLHVVKDAEIENEVEATKFIEVRNHEVVYNCLHTAVEDPVSSVVATLPWEFGRPPMARVLPNAGAAPRPYLLNERA
jgi:hypothetical protein